jgi:hypothetical protein
LGDDEGKEVKMQDNKITDEEFMKNLNKLTVKGNTDNTPDEDGFVEVMKKKK